MRKIFTLLLGFLCLTAGAAEVMPPAPAKYFNDYANVVPAATAAQLNQRLEEFERATSSQILVAIFSKMQSDSSIEDYTVRVAQSWKVGQKAKNNGAVLFVFTQDRKMFLQVGYGLEGALPDALCKRIIEDEIKPHFKAGDYGGGLTAGVNAILAATKGEYKGTGRTVAQPLIVYGNGGRQQQDSAQSIGIFFIVGVFILFFVFSRIMNRKIRGAGGNWHGWTIASGGSSSGWSSGGGGFSGGGGGGGFSGGGGSFGGGGSGGSW